MTIDNKTHYNTNGGHSTHSFIESRFTFIIALCLYKAILDFAYVQLVSEVYAYEGFSLSVDALKLSEAWVIVIFIGLILQSAPVKPSKYLSGFAFLIYIVPLLSFYSLSDAERWVTYLVLLQYLIMMSVTAGRSFAIKLVANGRFGCIFLCCILCVIATAWLVITVGLSSFSLSLDGVYDTRFEVNETAYTGIMGYILVWSTNIAGVLLLLVAVQQRRIMLSTLLFALFILWFGLATHKSILFYPLLCLAVFYTVKRTTALSLIAFALGVVGVLAIVSSEYLNNLFIGGTILRRVFFVPAHHTYVYFEFFQNESFVFWSDSLLSWSMANPYGESTALVIGDVINSRYSLGIPELWANNTFFSTGYMHAGLFGLCFYGVIAGIVLKVLDSILRRGVPLHFITAMCIVPFFNLVTSSDLFTALFTHGLGLVILFLFLYGGVRRGEHEF